MPRFGHRRDQATLSGRMSNVRGGLDLNAPIRPLDGQEALMWLIDQLAERAIDRARDRGELDGLPNEGRPLQLDDDSMVPPELRAAYRLLKNAGYLPEEVKLRREIRDAEQLLREARTEEERDEAGPRLRMLLNRLGSHRASSLLAQEAYYQQLRARVDTGGAGTRGQSRNGR